MPEFDLVKHNQEVAKEAVEHMESPFREDMIKLVRLDIAISSAASEAGENLDAQDQEIKQQERENKMEMMALKYTKGSREKLEELLKQRGFGNPYIREALISN